MQQLCWWGLIVIDRLLVLCCAEIEIRMRASHVCVIGARGLSAELCKNIVLAGIGQLTLVDDEKVTAAYGPPPLPISAAPAAAR